VKGAEGESWRGEVGDVGMEEGGPGCGGGHDAEVVEARHDGGFVVLVCWLLVVGVGRFRFGGFRWGETLNSWCEVGVVGLKKIGDG
jgi:hypothetical protein